MEDGALITALLLCVTFGVGAGSAVICRRLGVPAPFLVGALLGVAIFNVTTGLAVMPGQAKVFTQIVTGLFIGSRITRRDLSSLKTIVLPAAVASAAMIVCCVLMGILLYFVSDLSAATSLLSCAPGGLVDIILISYDLGADVSVVSVLQVLRLSVVVSIFPALMLKAVRRFQLQGAAQETAASVTPVGGVKPEDQRVQLQSMLLSILVATAGGLLGKWLGIPAGALILSLVATAVFNLGTGRVYMPLRVKEFAQILAGSLIGTSVTMAAVISLRYAIIPALIMVVGYFLITLFIAVILHKRYGFDMITAFLCIIPGGASDISLLAGDLGADAAKVSIIQVTRSTCVVLFFPPLVQLLAVLLP